jgi:hypothetical protein
MQVLRKGNQFLLHYCKRSRHEFSYKKLHFTLHNQSINHLISEPNRPPSIYYQPPDVVYFKPGEAIELKCIADGMPLPK